MSPRESSSTTPRSEGHCINVYSQNSRGLRATDLEEVLATMKTQSVFAWALQETWRVGDSIERHEEGFVAIHHGPPERLSRRGSLGVSIVLSPEAWTGFKKCGCKREYYGLRIIAVSTLVKDDKGEEVKIRLLSAYAPHSGCTEVEKVEYESQLALAIESCGEDEILLVGSDTNASVGRRTAQQVRDDDDGVQSPVGAFGLEWSNAAGTRLASFVGLRQLCLPTTFFQKSESSIPTWYQYSVASWTPVPHFHGARSPSDSDEHTTPENRAVTGSYPALTAADVDFSAPYVFQTTTSSFPLSKSDY